MNHWYVLALVIAGFSVVQSFFGVGLLIFGTPTLLLLGYPFESALATLLPASLSISIAQAFQGRAQCALPRAFFLWTVPFIALGLIAVLTGIYHSDMQVIVAVMLLLTALTRASVRVRMWMRSTIESNFRCCLAMTGLIHGFSNLGGGPLTIIMSTLHRERDAIRTNIAFGYLVFSAIQFAILVALKPAALSTATLVGPSIAIAMYFLFGNRAYQRTSEPAYQASLTGFTLCFAIALFARKFL